MYVRWRATRNSHSRTLIHGYLVQLRTLRPICPLSNKVVFALSKRRYTFVVCSHNTSVVMMNRPNYPHVRLSRHLRQAVSHSCPRLWKDRQMND